MTGRSLLIVGGLCGWLLLPGHRSSAADPAAAAGAGPFAASWEAKPYAEVQALDKVNARRASLVIKAGDSASFGSISIAVRSCYVRPPNQAKDATAFLVIRDSHEGEPGFSGWMLASAPAVSMLEHPIYDVRITGCRS